MELQHNCIKRFLFDNHGVRGEIVKLQQPFENLLHDSYPNALKKIMMELAVSSVLVASTLKDGSEIMIQLKGGNNAPLKYALINIRQDLSFYGSASLQEDAKLQDDDGLKEIAGEDAILVISVFPKDGPKWQGIVAVDTKSISATLENYFSDSQQLPTKFIILTDTITKQSGGILLQIIPEIEGNLESLEHLDILSQTLTADELFSLTPNEVLSRLFAHEEVKVYEPQAVEFRCICSKERCENALSKLANQEIKNLIEDNGTSMTCQHCGKQYSFTKEELESILRRVSQ